MRKSLSFALTILLLFSTLSVFAVPATAKMPSPDVLGGYENVCLTYTYRPGSSDYGRQTAEDLIPYVAYLDTKGTMQDFFFDTYLFLPCNTYGPSGASIHGGPNNPTVAIDWVDYVEDTFADGYNVDALESAFGRAKATLGDSERKAGVIFSILYPARNAKNFGSLGGKELDMTKKEDREYAIKWIIDEQIKLYEEGEYQNLDLIGFYWLEEEIYKDYDREMMLYASEYLHSLGLKFIWIPWFRAPGFNNWRAYGFDLACLQPNDMWPEVSDVNRVENCASLCDGYGMSMQIESSYECSGPEKYARYLRYLEGGMNSGAMNSVKFYYQDAKQGVYYSSCYTKQKTYRSVYDLTYKYAKGTLTKDDFKAKVAEAPFVIPKNVEWVSYGKSYTGCESYVDGNGMPYQDVDGKELTDGVLGSTDDGTEWHAYHISRLDDDDRMSTVLDLGEVRSDLTHVMAQFLDCQKYNVGAPEDVRIYVSDDGKSFEMLNKATLKKDGNMYHIKYEKPSGFTARYVKMSFSNGMNNFVFCSEFMVGSQIKTTNSEDSSAAVSGGENTENNSENGNILIWVLVGIAALAVIVISVDIIRRKVGKNKEQ